MFMEENNYRYIRGQICEKKRDLQDNYDIVLHRLSLWL